MTEYFRFTTVGDLINDLSTLPSDLPVILSSDGEGNNKSPLADWGQVMYVAEETWWGYTYPTPEQIDESDYYSEEDRAPGSAIRAVCLWPVN